MMLRLGSRGDLVTSWQRILHRLGFGRQCGAIDGVFGLKTEAATKAVEEHFSMPVTGAVTPELLHLTHEAEVALQGVHPVLAAARSQIGVAVETSTNRGPELQKFWDATTYPDGMKDRQPWCAAMLCWAVLTAMLADATLRITEATRPKSAAVKDWVPHALRHGWLVFGPHDGLRFPSPGDIVVYTFSHIGVVDSYDGRGIVAVEGNTDEAGAREGREAAARERKLNLCRSFIRLPRGVAR